MRGVTGTWNEFEEMRAARRGNVSESDLETTYCNARMGAVL